MFERRSSIRFKIRGTVVWGVSVSPLHDQYKGTGRNMQESRIAGRDDEQKKNESEKEQLQIHLNQIASSFFPLLL